MMKLPVGILFLVLLMGFPLYLCATSQAPDSIKPVKRDRRHVSPVESTSTTPTPVADRQQTVVLADTLGGEDFIDTIPSVLPKMIYPLVYRLDVGINAWDGLMRITGQKYGIGGAWAELNMHNRYFAYFEAGAGMASITPDNSNFTYRSPLSPYFKIGAAYNIFYNSNPDYQLLAGVRYGFTPFSFSVDDVRVSNGYWDETATFDIPSQHSIAGYLELALGVKVKIVGRFFMGWNLIYHSILHESKCEYGLPMYIPGYGKRTGSFAASMSLIWAFTLNKSTSTEVKE